jgi:NAD(P)-dependent dehydrogenase (short-subunit alcohol dehydrogenase family)
MDQDAATTGAAGRVCFVTGSTHGIGLATAAALARTGATVILHGRSPDRLDAVARTLTRQTGNRHVSGLTADFSSLDDVRRLARDVKSRHERLDVLVNNAGALSFGRRTTADGFEWHVGVNHLAPFLLTNLLLDTLQTGPPARIVNVASLAHRNNPIDLDDLNFERGYRTFAAYGRSKCANILFTVELARRLAPARVTANTLHPGVVFTNLLHTSLTMRWVWRLLRPALLSPEEGARTSIFLATSPEVEGVTGRYFVRCREATPEPYATDRTQAQRLWERSAALTGLV